MTSCRPPTTSLRVMIFEIHVSATPKKNEKNHLKSEKVDWIVDEPFMQTSLHLKHRVVILSHTIHVWYILPICFDFLWQMQVNVSVPWILWVYYTCSLFSPIFFDKHLVCACRRKNYFTVYQPVYLLVYRTWMSQEVCERLGSVGCNPKEYPGLIGRWNNPLILTIDPNFLGHPVVHLKAKKPAVKGQTLF